MSDRSRCGCRRQFRRLRSRCSNSIEARRSHRGHTRPCCGGWRRNRLGWWCGRALPSRRWRGRGGCCRLPSVAFSQQSASDAQGSFGLIDINGFGQDQVGADPERFRDSGLTFHHRDGKRRLVGRRIARAFEQQRGVLLVIAVDHDSVEVLAHQPLNRGEGFSAGFDAELQLAQDLRHCASGFFIGTEEKSLVTHTKVIVGTPVRSGKLRAVIRDGLIFVAFRASGPRLGSHGPENWLSRLSGLDPRA